MSLFEVETDLLVSVRVRVQVEAATKEAAIDTASAFLPQNATPERSKGWSAAVTLKAPKGVRVEVVKAYHFQQTSGSDKARKVKP